VDEWKPGHEKRALRRHHDQRKKAWVRKTLTHYFTGLTTFPADRVGRYARTPKMCSCFMCGNPRRFQGEPTLQERRAMPGYDGSGSMFGTVWHGCLFHAIRPLNPRASGHLIHDYPAGQSTLIRPVAGAQRRG
jgi:hypothetical protein